MRDLPLLTKIDIHVHSRAPGAAAMYCTPEKLREMYDSIHVECGVLLPYRPGDVHDTPLIGEDGKALAEAYPDTLRWWFCNVDSRAPLGSPLDDRAPCSSPTDDLSVPLARYKAMGARGVGEVTPSLRFTDDWTQNLFHHTERCGMPLTFHMGWMRPDDYGLVDDLGLPGLEYSLANFPRLRFLGHSQKFWAEIGTDVTEENRGGLPDGPVEPGRLVALMRRYPNLLCDLSANSGHNGITRDPAFGCRFLEEFADRVFFGTDICSPANYGFAMMKLSGFLDDAMRDGRISYDTYERVSRKNALALLEG